MDEIDVNGDGGRKSKQRHDGQNVADMVVQMVMKDCWCRDGARQGGCTRKCVERLKTVVRKQDKG